MRIAARIILGATAALVLFLSGPSASERPALASPAALRATGAAVGVGARPGVPRAADLSPHPGVQKAPPVRSDERSKRVIAAAAIAGAAAFYIAVRSRRSRRRR